MVPVSVTKSKFSDLITFGRSLFLAPKSDTSSGTELSFTASQDPPWRPLKGPDKGVEPQQSFN
jgi:hypothetical protein